MSVTTSPEGFEEFHDPRLVALYDLWGADREDTAFYLDLAARLGVRTMLDLGCGTGQITVEFARRGIEVTGIDPAAAMLEVARGREGGHLVRWIEGDAFAYDGTPVDFALMSAHVAQVIAEEEAWRAALNGLAAAIRPGGHLAFESRNPAAREWERWNPEDYRQHFEETSLGPVEVWAEMHEVQGDLVRYDLHYRLQETGEELISRDLLRFRSEEALRTDLERAGFEVIEVFGDWDGSPFSEESPEMIFVARRR